MNEQSYEFWRKLFREHDFIPFDCIRPKILSDFKISYWYRFNILLYVQRQSIAALAPEILNTRIDDDARIQTFPH